MQIRSTLLCSGLPSLAGLLSNRPTRVLLQKFSLPLMSFANDENTHAALIKREPHAYIDIDIFKEVPFSPTESAVTMHHKDGGS